VGPPVSQDPGIQILGAGSINQPVLPSSSAPSGFPFPCTRNNCPSIPSPCPGPDTVGHNRDAVASTFTPPPPMAHLEIKLKLLSPLISLFALPPRWHQIPPSLYQWADQYHQTPRAPFHRRVFHGDTPWTGPRAPPLCRKPCRRPATPTQPPLPPPPAPPFPLLVYWDEESGLLLKDGGERTVMRLNHASPPPVAPGLIDHPPQ